MEELGVKGGERLLKGGVSLATYYITLRKSYSLFSDGMEF